MGEHIASASLSADRSLEADVRGEGPGAAITVRLRRGQELLGEVTLPYPKAGLAGGHFVLSPSQHLAVLSIFSGQSEEGYELFRLNDSIARITGLPYQVGEFASFCFSSDEALLVMALPFRCSEWWLPWDEGEAHADGQGRFTFGFGQVRVHDIAKGDVSVHEMQLSAPATWHPSRVEYDPDLRPTFLSADRLQLWVPWGPIVLPFPPPMPVVLPVDG